MNELKKRIVDISYKNHASHIGSCLVAVDFIEAIYKMKAPTDPFILSNGHAGLAQYVVMEKYEGKNAEALYAKHGTHPSTDDGIFASTGSLGHGIGIALGMAMSDMRKTVYCMVSDGETREGSFWEALRIAAEQEVKNLIVFVVANGYGAYHEIDLKRLEWQIAGFVNNKYPMISFNEVKLEEPYMNDQNAHYLVLDEQKYKEIMEYYEKSEMDTN